MLNEDDYSHATDEGLTVLTVRMYMTEQLMVEIRCNTSGFNSTSFTPYSLSEENQRQLIRVQG